MFTLGAFAIILDADRRVLLCHRRDMDRWNLPGGGVQREETPWEAVVREVSEEVGLAIVVDTLLGVYAYPPADDLVFSFLCHAIDGKLALSDEADDLGYFAADRLPTTTHAHHAIRIRDYFERPERLVLSTLPVLPQHEFGLP